MGGTPEWLMQSHTYKPEVQRAKTSQKTQGGTTRAPPSKGPSDTCKSPPMPIPVAIDIPTEVQFYGQCLVQNIAGTKARYPLLISFSDVTKDLLTSQLVRIPKKWATQGVHSFFHFVALLKTYTLSHIVAIYVIAGNINM